LRAPYWDWAADVIPPEEVYALKELNILTPNGYNDVRNPLLSYKFPEGEDSRVNGLFGERTVRHPNPTHPDDLLR
jgi:tyrosinase